MKPLSGLAAAAAAAQLLWALACAQNATNQRVSLQLRGAGWRRASEPTRPLLYNLAGPRARRTTSSPTTASWWHYYCEYFTTLRRLSNLLINPEFTSITGGFCYP